MDTKSLDYGSLELFPRFVVRTRCESPGLRFRHYSFGELGLQEGCLIFKCTICALPEDTRMPMVVSTNDGNSI